MGCTLSTPGEFASPIHHHYPKVPSPSYDDHEVGLSMFSNLLDPHLVCTNGVDKTEHAGDDLFGLKWPKICLDDAGKAALADGDVHVQVSHQEGDQKIKDWDAIFPVDDQHFEKTDQGLCLLPSAQPGIASVQPNFNLYCPTVGSTQMYVYNYEITSSNGISGEPLAAKLNELKVRPVNFDDNGLFFFGRLLGKMEESNVQPWVKEHTHHKGPPEVTFLATSNGGVVAAIKSQRTMDISPHYQETRTSTSMYLVVPPTQKDSTEVAVASADVVFKSPFKYDVVEPKVVESEPLEPWIKTLEKVNEVEKTRVLKAAHPGESVCQWKCPWS